GLERDRREAGDLGQSVLELGAEPERALGALLILKRVQVTEAGECGEPLVDARVVLHRAGAEGVEARVDAEVACRELGEVAHEIRLRQLRQPGCFGSAKLAGDLRYGKIRDRRPARATAADRFLVDELQLASTSASRSIS